ncbi:hypothetical protein LXL04_022969 [Taraxacum kok-saghyz]
MQEEGSSIGREERLGHIATDCSTQHFVLSTQRYFNGKILDLPVKHFSRIRLLIPFSLDIPLNHISTRVAPLFSKKRDQNSVPFFSAEYDLRVHLKWRVRRPSRCSYASPRHIISFSKNIVQSSIKMKTRLKGREQALKDRNEIQST